MQQAVARLGIKDKNHLPNRNCVNEVTRGCPVGDRGPTPQQRNQAPEDSSSDKDFESFNGEENGVR